jgi:transcriptional regulator with XRE-family HTH domain
MNQLRVKEILKQKGLNQKMLAESIGVAEISLSRSLNGNPSLETLDKIANALDVPISALFEEPARDVINCPACGAKLTLNKA